MPSEQADEVAWEDMPPTLAPVFVQQLTAPPTILWRRGDGDDIARLEDELLVDGRGVVVQRLYYNDCQLQKTPAAPTLCSP